MLSKKVNITDTAATLPINIADGTNLNRFIKIRPPNKLITDNKITNSTYHTAARCCKLRIINADTIANLSAIGSSTLPKLDTWFNNRARKPSKKSVITAVRYSIKALRLLPL